MKVSIVLATWMGERFIAEQLQSFMDQTLQPDELVVRDDGSTDATLELVRQFAAKAKFNVRILPSGPRLGYAANFATLLRAAEGDIIFLSDQDDVWLPHKIETIVGFAGRNPQSQLIINDLEIVKDDLSRTGVSKLGNILTSGLDSSHFMTGCATALRKDFIDTLALPLPAGLKAHDRWLHQCAHLLGVRTVFSEVLQLYRRHGNNASNALASSPRRLTPMETGMRTLLHSPKESHVQQLLISKALKERLGRLNEYQRHILFQRVHIPDSKIEHALAYLERRTHSLEGRVRVLEEPWPGRIAFAAAFWLRGGYKDFQGVKSLVRDAFPSAR